MTSRLKRAIASLGPFDTASIMAALAEARGIDEVRDAARALKKRRGAKTVRSPHEALIVWIDVEVERRLSRHLRCSALKACEDICERGGFQMHQEINGKHHLRIIHDPHTLRRMHTEAAAKLRRHPESAEGYHAAVDMKVSALRALIAK